MAISKTTMDLMQPSHDVCADLCDFGIALTMT